MRWTRLSLALAGLATLAGGISVDCDKIVVDRARFDLSALEGRHSVWDVRRHPPNKVNTTYTLNPCGKLRKTKGVPADEECPNGAHVCAVEHLVHDDGTTDPAPLGVKVIAGDFIHTDGRHLNPLWTRLSTSDREGDAGKEGLRLELHGGKYPYNRKGQDQKAVVEFLCDMDRTGLEESSLRNSTLQTRTLGADSDDDDSPPNDVSPPDTSLRFVSYNTGDAEDVLHLEWRTKHACEGQAQGGKEEKEKEKSKSNHWGFFTWFIIIVFMGTAAYLIFGSWLNYNRYGARGWDLVPHGDTIRDMPYLLKDWGRRVVDSVQGGPSRAGYSAV